MFKFDEQILVTKYAYYLLQHCLNKKQAQNLPNCKSYTDDEIDQAVTELNNQNK